MRKALFWEENLWKDTKCEIGYLVHFQVPFLTAMGNSRSGNSCETPFLSIK